MRVVRVHLDSFLAVKKICKRPQDISLAQPHREHSLTGQADISAAPLSDKYR